MREEVRKGSGRWGQCQIRVTSSEPHTRPCQVRALGRSGERELLPALRTDSIKQETGNVAGPRDCQLSRK